MGEPLEVTMSGSALSKSLDIDYNHFLSLSDRRLLPQLRKGVISKRNADIKVKID